MIPKNFTDSENLLLSCFRLALNIATRRYQLSDEKKANVAALYLDESFKMQDLNTEQQLKVCLHTFLSHLLDDSLAEVAKADVAKVANVEDSFTVKEWII